MDAAVGLFRGADEEQKRQGAEGVQKIVKPRCPRPELCDMSGLEILTVEDAEERSGGECEIDGDQPPAPARGRGGVAPFITRYRECDGVHADPSDGCNDCLLRKGAAKSEMDEDDSKGRSGQGTIGGGPE